jgi:hypothetical protein
MVKARGEECRQKGAELPLVLLAIRKLADWARRVNKKANKKRHDKMKRRYETGPI